MSLYREYQFDGLVGPTHNYAGLSVGNQASTKHKGVASNPKAAFLEGLEKMKFVASLGVMQALLPPHDRPHLATLRRLGYYGSDEKMLADVAKKNPHLLRLVSSASSMWTANAATVGPSSDSEDAKLHLVPANLRQMFHRAIEAPTTTQILRAIFSNSDRFSVHDPLPGGLQFADEGAANHTRLKTAKAEAHLFAWGREHFGPSEKTPKKFPARQSLEASQALARLHRLKPEACYFPKQMAKGIDTGAFHTDVLAVGNQNFFMFHEWAFEKKSELLKALRQRLGEELVIVEVSNKKLPIRNAVKAYPFNSQVLSLPNGEMTILAPEDSKTDRFAYRFLESLKTNGGPIKSVHYLKVRQSMQNGGGPACLRLRVLMNAEERQAIKASVFFNDELGLRLKTCCEKYYRDQLLPKDLEDPSLARQSMTALDEFTSILKIGSVYDFQMARGGS